MWRHPVPLMLSLIVAIPALAEEEAFETRAAFFRLDTAAAGWEQADPDGDGLTTREELERGTDPLASDTDRDGFADGKDQAPLSRVYIEWGSPVFTQGDDYRYSSPTWLVGSFQKGGKWVSEKPYGWLADDEADPLAGLLAMVVNPVTLGSDLVVEVTFEDEAGGDLRAGLLNGEGAYAAPDLTGNLVTGKGGEKLVKFNALFVENPDAVALVLYRKGGKVTVYRTTAYVDEDGDGLDREQEKQLGTSDHNADSDGDGLKDYDEVFKYGTDPYLKDSDGDGMPDGWEVANTLDPKVNDGALDADGDGKSNFDECRLGRNPNAAPKPDTAGLTRLVVGSPLEAEPHGED